MRVDSGAEAGYEVLPLYDPMIAKLIVWDVDREASTQPDAARARRVRDRRAEDADPVPPALLATEQWRNGETCRDLVEDKEWLKQLAFPAAAQADDEEAEETVERKYAVEVSGRKFDVKVIGAAGGRTAPRRPGRRQAPRARAQGRRRRRRPRRSSSRRSRAPCSRWPSSRAPQVEEGALICVIEAMKMENEITAPSPGTVEELGVSEGGSVATGDTIAVIK